MKPFDSELINAFRERLVQMESTIAIIPHINADGDAIGSVLGLAGILKNAGKKVVVLSPNHFPNFLKWMEGAREILVYTSSRKKVEQALSEAGMMICLDFNQAARAGEMKELVEKFPGPGVVIDHHPYPKPFTELMISHPESSSTAELVFHVAKAMGYDRYINKSVAEAIYCGIMTDTGSFDYNVSDPQTFQTVSELLTYGIDPEAIHGKVFDNYSEERMRLLGYCLNECMEVYPEYHSAMMYLSKEVQQKYNFLSGDNEGFVNYPLSIKGIHFSAFFTEKEDHIKVSFRSKGEFPVNDFAVKNFNGGGHRNASGGEIYAPLQETLEKFRQLLPEYRTMLKKTRI
ncbi:MAG: bifunctional oligoribonuclease/PAP phosphatase NrnA [Prolixibacteraceae bacterium]